MSKTEAPVSQPPAEEKSLGERTEFTLVTDNLESRCVLGTHPKYGVYFQGYQCEEGSIYPHTGTCWSQHGDRGPGVCHNPENPVILPIWEWMSDVGFTEAQLAQVKDFLVEHNLLDAKVGEAKVKNANL